MRCGEVVDPTATWKESYRALEKAYAEGYIMSIGVSNFGLEILTELWGYATVKPHVVQNFADPSNLDTDVREFCYDKELLYVPYALQRNYNHLSTQLKSLITTISDVHNKTPNEVILKAFLQSHAAVIPRSDNVQHIFANINNCADWELSDDEMVSLGWPSAAAGAIEL